MQNTHRDNVTIPEDLQVYLQTETVMAAREMITGREHVPILIKETAKNLHRSYKADAGRAATVSWDWEEFSGGRDALNLTPVDTNIPILGTPLDIPRTIYDQAMEEGYDLLAAYTDEAGFQPAYLEDKMIYRGFTPDDSTYTIDGLYEAAGNNYSTSADWGTAANIRTSVAGAIALAMADKIYGSYGLGVATVQWNQLMSAVESEKATLENIMNQLNPHGGEAGRPYHVPYLAAGTAMLHPTVKPMGSKEHNHYKLVVFEELFVDAYPKNNSKKSAINLDAAMRSALVVWDSNAIVQLSAI